MQWWMILIVLSRAATWRPDSVSISMLHYPIEWNSRSRRLVLDNNNRTNKFEQTIQQPTSPLDMFYWKKKFKLFEHMANTVVNKWGGIACLEHDATLRHSSTRYVTFGEELN